jgi:hypothetical protein
MIGNGPAEALFLQAKPLHLLFEFKRPNKARLDNRWGCFVGHAFRDLNPLSRFNAHPRPSGASA